MRQTDIRDRHTCEIGRQTFISSASVSGTGTSAADSARRDSSNVSNHWADVNVIVDPDVSVIVDVDASSDVELDHEEATLLKQDNHSLSFKVTTWHRKAV